MIYSVNYWGSHPDNGNDDFNTGLDFATLEEAEAQYAADSIDRHASHIELCVVTQDADVTPKGQGIENARLMLCDTLKVRENPSYVKTEDDESEWLRESAMMAGMAFGCDGFNDVMGY